MRENKTKYGVLAVLMVIGMIGAVTALDSIPALSLFGMAALFLVCSAALLFCLMKLEVMDFQEGSFWYELNQQVNAPKQRRAVQRSYSTGHIVSGHTALAKGM